MNIRFPLHIKSEQDLKASVSYRVKCGLNIYVCKQIDKE